MSEHDAKRRHQQDTRPDIPQVTDTEEAKVADTLRDHVDQHPIADPIQALQTGVQDLSSEELDQRIDELLIKMRQESDKLGNIMKKTADRQRDLGIIASQVGTVSLPASGEEEQKLASIAAELQGKHAGILELARTYVGEREKREAGISQKGTVPASQELPPPLPAADLNRTQVSMRRPLSQPRANPTPWTDRRMTRDEFLSLTGRGEEALAEDDLDLLRKEEEAAPEKHDKNSIDIRRIGYNRQYTEAMNDYRAIQQRITELQALQQRANPDEAAQAAAMLALEQKKLAEAARKVEYLNDELDALEQREKPLQTIEQHGTDIELSKKPEELADQIKAIEAKIDTEKDMLQQLTAEGNSGGADYALSRMVQLENRRELLKARLALLDMGTDPDLYPESKQVQLAYLKKEFKQLSERDANSEDIDKKIISLDAQIKNIEGSRVLTSRTSSTPSGENFVKTLVGTGKPREDFDPVHYFLEKESTPVHASKPAKKPSVFGKIAAGFAGIIAAFSGGDAKVKQEPAAIEAVSKNTTRDSAPAAPSVSKASPEVSAQRTQEQQAIPAPANLPVGNAELRPGRPKVDPDHILDQVYKQVQSPGPERRTVSSPSVQERTSPKAKTVTTPKRGSFPREGIRPDYAERHAALDAKVDSFGRKMKALEKRARKAKEAAEQAEALTRQTAEAKKDVVASPSNKKINAGTGIGRRRPADRIVKNIGEGARALKKLERQLKEKGRVKGVRTEQKKRAPVQESVRAQKESRIAALAKEETALHSKMAAASEEAMRTGGLLAVADIPEGDRARLAQIIAERQSAEAELAAEASAQQATIASESVPVENAQQGNRRKPSLESTDPALKEVQKQINELNGLYQDWREAAEVADIAQDTRQPAEQIAEFRQAAEDARIKYEALKKKIQK